MALYVGATYANLEEETAKGEGEHMHAMLNIMGCNVTSHPAIIESIRIEFHNVLQKSDYSSKTKLVRAEEYFNLVGENIDSSYAQFCNII